MGIPSSPPGRPHHDRGVRPQNAAAAVFLMPSPRRLRNRNPLSDPPSHPPSSGPRCSQGAVVGSSIIRFGVKGSRPAAPCSHSVSRWRHLIPSHCCVKDWLRDLANSSPSLTIPQFRILTPPHRTTRGGSLFFLHFEFRFTS